MIETVMTPPMVEAWIAKAGIHADELLALPGVPAAPSPVASRAAPPGDAPYGRFMLSWPATDGGVRVINHLPDGEFFLDLLRRVYAPVFAERADLARALDDGSRLEMAVTNDVLQVQLDQLAEGYSMIRHHALMLFESVTWLDPPAGQRWAAIFTACIGLAMRGRPAAPSPAELTRIERSGFAAMSECAPAATSSGAWELLPATAVRAIAEYHLWASAAIGVLCRGYAGAAAAERTDWHRRQLGRYRDPDYLLGELTSLTPGAGLP
jgi:hypothetical protein